MRFDQMRMYQAAEAMVAEVELLLPRARIQRPKTATQLERCAESALLNMSEGIACFKPRMKISAYEISKKEANEVRAALRKLVIANVFSRMEVQKAYNTATAVIGMLTAAIIAAHRRLDDEETPEQTSPPTPPPEPPPDV